MPIITYPAITYPPSNLIAALESSFSQVNNKRNFNLDNQEKLLSLTKRIDNINKIIASSKSSDNSSESVTSMLGVPKFY